MPKLLTFLGYNLMYQKIENLLFQLFCTFKSENKKEFFFIPSILKRLCNFKYWIVEQKECFFFKARYPTIRKKGISVGLNRLQL